MDPREQRTRQRLRGAILALASKQPASTLTVSAVASAANVSRDTFYRHAASPVALLKSVLNDDLDALPVPDAGGVQEFRLAESTLLEHIAEHESIYRNALVHGSEGPVRNLLTERLISTLSQYAANHPEIVPEDIRSNPLSNALPIAVAYAAAGTVGAIEVWLRTAEHGNLASTTDAARAILAASPAWWLQPLG